MLFVFLHLIVLAGWPAVGARTRPRGRTPPPVRPDAASMANATGDRLQGYIERELTRRMAPLRHQPVPDLGRRVLHISEINFGDEGLYDWIPDYNESRQHYARRLAQVQYKFQEMYHTNYIYEEPPTDDAISKMHSIMREKMYRSRDMIDELMPHFEKYRDSLKLRFAFVFRRLDNLLDEMAAIYSHMYHWRDYWHVLKSVFYHQHMLRRHIDVVYIVERTISMYMWYKERERRLNSILAQRMQTEASYA